MIKKGWILLSVILFSFSIGFFFEEEIVAKPVAVHGFVVSVYDGDTFRARLTEGSEMVSKIRIKDIDCYERYSSFSRKQVQKQMERWKLSEMEVYRRGEKARSLLEKYVIDGHHRVTLMIDMKNPYDRYGRILAHVYIRDVNIAGPLLKSGYCFPYDGQKKSLSHSKKNPSLKRKL